MFSIACENFTIMRKGFTIRIAFKMTFLVVDSGFLFFLIHVCSSVECVKNLFPSLVQSD